MKWIIFCVVFVIWMAYVLDVSAQDDMEYRMQRLEWEQYQLERDMQMQQLRRQQQHTYEDIERTLEIEDILFKQQLRQEMYKRDNEEEEENR